MLRIFKPCTIVVVMVLSSYSLPGSGTFFRLYDCYNKVITVTVILILLLVCHIKDHELCRYPPSGVLKLIIIN